MWMDETGAADQQPEGFAAPETAPLGPYSTTLKVVADDDPAPADYAAAKDPGPSLDTIAPAPPATRDPHLPFEAGQEDQMASAAERDPREPFVSFTHSGAPDFAPPTGDPVTTANWAPPTGAPVASAAGAASSDPYAQRWASMQAGQTTPMGYPSPGAAYPAPGQPRRGSALVAEYRASDGLGKLAAVMKALPWPVLLILLVGLFFQQGAWAIWGICIAFIVCSANAKIAQQTLSRAFMIACVVYFCFWLVYAVAGAVNWTPAIPYAYYTIGQWLSAILIVATPVIVWRAFEKER